MNNFIFNLSRVLAHTLVLENQAIERDHGIAPGYFRNDTPQVQAPNPAQVSKDTLLAQMQAMEGSGDFASVGSIPQLYQKYSPIFNQIQLDSIKQYLTGSNGNNGMLQLYGDQLQPAINRIQTASRAGEIGDIQSLGPKALQAMRDYNPQGTALIDAATGQVLNRVNSGGQLDPFTQRALQQNYRAAEGARGFGGGQADAAMEAYYQTATQEQRQLQNIDLANRQAAMNQSYYGDPFAQILQRSSGANNAMNMFSQAAGASSNATSPVAGAFTLPSASSMYGSYYNAQQQANMYNAQSQNDLMGGLMSMGGQLAGGLMSGAGSAGGFSHLFR